MRIERHVGTARILSLYSVFVAATSLLASACSYSYIPTKIGKNFSVQVLYRSKPLAGVQIELSTEPRKGDSRPVLTIPTNEEGLVEFSDVRPAPYFVSIKHPAFSQSAEIVVTKRRTNGREEKITFEWPGSNPLAVRSVSGLLNAPVKTGNPLNDQAHPTFGIMDSAKLTLSQAVTGEVIEVENASESGAFGFQSVPAGLYVLHIETVANARPRYLLEGYVPIEIEPLAKASTLNLFLYQGVCGALGYENREEAITN